MREEIGTYDAYSETVKKLGDGGLLLASGETGNPMTIGWGTIGIIWGRPMFVVLVRPSRYTFGLLEDCGEFVVDVPTQDLKKEVALCGSKSGRDIDKIEECGFTLEKSRNVAVPYIKQCPVHYECRVVHKNSVINADLAPEIVQQSYPSGDFHRVYYGQILGVYREG
jgi:flavin reductase (DIM6/NTAB) family NADH-FMN oxidoreductase RutF